MQKKILKGKAVSTGKATGFVRIIKNEKDFSKVKNKDILVIKSGERIFINIVKKGIGIIMNSGGITSHIAKTSRELNKPCIILKNAVKEHLLPEIYNSTILEFSSLKSDEVVLGSSLIAINKVLQNLSLVKEYLNI